MIERIATPRPFDLGAVAESHGWITLAPFVHRPGEPRIETTVEFDGEALPIVLTPGKRDEVELRAPGRGKRRQLREIGERMLGLDVCRKEFYGAVREHEDFRWIARGGHGRLLRSPSLFEDLIKLVLTTNCTWALTKIMCRNLVELYGAQGKAFPTPERLAALDPADLRERAKTGYRSPSLVKLARSVTAGEIDPQSWIAREPEEVHAELLTLPGVGPYVADNVMRMIGRPAGLGLDSVLRAFQAEAYHGGRRVTDRTIERRYRRFGRWAGLVIWCDLCDPRRERE